MAVAMASKSDRYDVIFDDYNYSPQFIAEGALENLEPYRQGSGVQGSRGHSRER